MVGKYISQQHSLYLTDGSKLNIVNKPKLSKKLLIEGKSQKEGGKVDYSSLFLIMGGFHSIIKSTKYLGTHREEKHLGHGDNTDHNPIVWPDGGHQESSFSSRLGEHI